ncbi:hypothetical protein M404DRAFT_1007535 [Pisolithus tinctorius Marx 270]|uniref:Uncharacterized protein n=1 Tax=Pisolithus tinctorius Marx 270 TaxID=870435 RepID=A0A0C3N2Z5_PISTI|nr:hypothetical protein M404DRAFT_1007535 [Pisolithus tinctorius Marx 270]
MISGRHACPRDWCQPSCRDSNFVLHNFNAQQNALASLCPIRVSADLTERIDIEDQILTG